MTKRISNADRFWSKVDKTSVYSAALSSYCWVWLGGRYKDGYGAFGVTEYSTGKCKIKMLRAHRFSYELEHGFIPDGQLVLHHCDNPICVNPDHLFSGTCQDNHDDMIRKGRRRNGVTLGSKQRDAKLTESDIPVIRKMYSTEEKTISEIARLYRVSRHPITMIVKGKLWKHVK